MEKVAFVNACVKALKECPVGMSVHVRVAVPKYKDYMVNLLNHADINIQAYKADTVRKMSPEPNKPVIIVGDGCKVAYEQWNVARQLTIDASEKNYKALFIYAIARGTPHPDKSVIRDIVYRTITIE